MQFYRRPQPIAAISFDLDDTLYDNVPVMRKAEAEGYRALCELFPQAQQWTQQQWAERRWQLMRSEADLASDMTLLRLATIQRGLMALGVDETNAKIGAEQGLQAFLAARNQVVVPAQTHDMLTALGQRYPLIAISNGNVDTRVIGLHDYFSQVIQPGDGRRGKPYPDMFTAAQQQLPQLQPAQWLHVGDSPLADVLGAHRVGWQSAWFRGGLYDEHGLIVLPTFAYGDNQTLADFLLD
jgi:putative hydrolase of the HAD superfamily